MKTATALVIAALVAMPSLVFAQQGLVAPREGNIWGGTAHEPVPGAVHSAEQAAGVGQSAAQAQQQNQEVEQLARQLTGQSTH